MSDALKIRDHRDILLAPVVSEKSSPLLDETTHTFCLLYTSRCVSETA